MIRRETPRKTRRAGSHKLRSGGSNFCIRLQAPRSPDSPVFTVRASSESANLVGSRTNAPASSSNSISSYHLRQQPPGILKRPLKARGEIKGLPAVPALVYDSSGSSTSAESLALPLSASGSVCDPMELSRIGANLYRRQSIPEELLSPDPKAESFGLSGPQLPPRSSSVPLILEHRTRSFADRLEMRLQRECSDEKLDSTGSLQQNDSPPSSATGRRGRPPPITIPPPRHRRQHSAPLLDRATNVELPAASSPATESKTFDQPAIVTSIRIPTLPPRVSSLIPPSASTHSRTSTLSTTSTDSTKTITPAFIGRASRVESIHESGLRPSGHERASSLPLPQLLAGLRDSSIAMGQPEMIVYISGRGNSPKEGASKTGSATASPKESEASLAGHDILSPTNQPLSALSFPADADRYSSGSSLAGSHQQHRLSNSTSYELGSLPFVIPSVPAIPAIPQIPSLPVPSVSPSQGLLKPLPTVPNSQDDVIAENGSPPLPPKPTHRPLEQLRLANMRRPSASSIDRVLSVFIPEPPSPALPFPWKTLPSADAKRLIDPKTLQDIVVDSVRSFANQKLVINDVPDIAVELEMATSQLLETRNQFQAECDQREKLLLRHVACLHSLNGDEGARFAQSLVNAIARSDRIARRQAKISEHIVKVANLQATHSRAAASLCLSKLNTAFTRSREAEKVARTAQATAEAQRDEALAKLKAMEDAFTQFADQQGRISLEGVTRNREGRVDDTQRRSVASDGLTTPKTEISFSLPDLRVSSLRFPLPPISGNKARPTRPAFLVIHSNESPSKPLSRSGSTSSVTSPPSSSQSPAPTTPATSAVDSETSSPSSQSLEQPPLSPYLFPRAAPSVAISPAPIEQPSPTLSPAPSNLAAYLAGGRRPSQVVTDTLRHATSALRSRSPPKDVTPQVRPLPIPAAAVAANTLTSKASSGSLAKRFRSSSEPPVVAPFDKTGVAGPRPIFSDADSDGEEETLESLEGDGRVRKDSTRSRHGRKKSNLTSITLSEVDTRDLAEMLAVL